MRHRAHGRKLGRTPSHRTALFRNQLTQLFRHDRIMTTRAKAKELRPLAEKMVTLARTGTLANRRRVQRMVRDREVLARLFDDIAPRFADRPGGYTRVIPLGPRHGDNAEMALIEFVDYELESEEGPAEKGKKSFVDRARGMFGAGAKTDEGEAETVEETAAEPAEAEEPDEPVEKSAAEAEPETEEPAEEAAEEKTEAEEPSDEETEEKAEAEPTEDDEKKNE